MIGKIYRLHRAVLAIETTDGSRQVVTLPEGSIIRVESDVTPTDSRMARVRWRDRQVAIFGVDIEERGEEVFKHRFVEDFPAAS